MTDKIRDYNFKKNIIRCDKCHKKLFHLNSTHHCIVYEPCSLEAQDRCDYIDDENNRNKTGLYFDSNGQQYTLNDEPLPKGNYTGIVLDIRAQSDMFKRFECEYCGQQINNYQREKHQSTKKCQKIKAKYYRG